MTLKEIKTKAKDYISKGSLNKSIYFLKDILLDNNDFISFESRYNESVQEFNNGRLAKDKFDAIQGKIKYSFLVFIDDLSLDNLKLQNNSDFFLQQEVTELYDEYINNFSTKIVSNLGIPLKDLYIEPNFSVHRNYIHSSISTDNKEQYLNVGIDIHSHLFKWFNNEDYRWKRSDDSENKIHHGHLRLMILQGNAGQGKTAFCLRLAHDLSQEVVRQNIRVLFPNLRDLKMPIKYQSGSVSVLSNYFSENYNINIDFKNDKKTLIILDGLNELIDLDSINARDLIKDLYYINESFPNFFVLLTCREGYIDVGDISTKNTIVFKLNKFTDEQQNNWLKNYYDNKSPSQSSENKLAELKKLGASKFMNQPVFLELMVNSEKFLQPIINESSIYKAYFKHISAENWNKNASKYSTTKEKDQLNNILQTLAFLMTLAKNDNSLDNKTLEDSTEEVFKNIRIYLNCPNVAERLLEIPYIGKANIDRSNYSIKFNENYIREYLAAEFLYEKTIEFFKGTDLTKEKTLYFINEYYAQINLDQEISRHLINIIESDNKTLKKGKIAEAMIEDLNYLIDKDFYKPNLNRSIDTQPIEKSLNAWFYYWIIYSHLESGKCRITSRTKTRFKELIDYASRKNRSGLRFFGADLSGTKLAGAILQNVDFTRTNLREADLSGVEFKNSTLNGADLTKTNFENANLEGVDFSPLELRIEREKNDSEENLSKKEQIEIDKEYYENKPYFFDTILENSIFKNANLQKSVFSGTTLESTNFNGADLRNANFENVKFNQTFFCNADLRGAIFNSFSLKKVNLIGAKVESREWLETKNIDDETKYKIFPKPFFDSNQKVYYIVVDAAPIIILTKKDLDGKIITNFFHNDGFRNIQNVQIDNPDEIVQLAINWDKKSLIIYNDRNGYEFNSLLHLEIEKLLSDFNNLAVLWLTRDYIDKYEPIDIHTEIFTENVLNDLRERKNEEESKLNKFSKHSK